VHLTMLVCLSIISALLIWSREQGVRRWLL
jgi:hypothetical protein